MCVPVRESVRVSEGVTGAGRLSPSCRRREGRGCPGEEEKMAVIATAGGHRGSGIAEGVNRGGFLDEDHGFVALELSWKRADGDVGLRLCLT